MENENNTQAQVPTPPTNQPSPGLKTPSGKLSKKLFLVFLLVLMAVIGTGGYIMGTKKSQPVSTPSPSPLARPTPVPDFVQGEVLVKFKSNATRTQIQTVIDSIGAVQVDEIQQIGLKKLKVPLGQEQQIVVSLNKNPLVEYAELNYNTGHILNQTQDTSNWKTYTNASLGISFKYPAQYDSHSTTEVFEVKQDLTALKADSELWVAFPQSDVILLSIYYYKSSLSANEWWNKEGVSRYTKLVRDFYDSSLPHKDPFKPPQFSIGELTIAGQPALVAKGFVDAALKGDTVISVVSYKGGIFLFEQLNQLPNNEALDKSNQILSTFRFD